MSVELLVGFAITIAAIAAINPGLLVG